MEKKVKIATPQFERTWELDFDYIPKTEAEFVDTVENSPTYILKGLGFGLWDTINSVALENSKKPKHNIVPIPAYEMTDGGFIQSDTPLRFDTGHGDSPTEQSPVDMEIWLIPGEWYNVIPDGYMLTCITGCQEPFKKGETDNDIRFGCLAYGVLKPVNP